MKYVNRVGSKKSSLALFGASLCGFLGVAAACAGETQPLNSVSEASAGGSGGSNGSGGASVHTTSGATVSTGSGGGGNASAQSTSGVTVSTGSGGSGGSSSERDVVAKKLDILFVVDNSINMASKQSYLASAATELLDRLADPKCVDGDDPALTEGCPEGKQREFAPVADMHVGVISSSLGGHGGDICSPQSPAQWNSTQNDAARLMPSVRNNLSSYQALGFLAWDRLGVDEEAEHNLEALKDNVSEHILSVGEMGCGYEAPLEAMYRFLIDPAPPQAIEVVDNEARPAADAAGNVLVDNDLLGQRADFLRPDSALVVVLLSDEDDCSVVEGGLGWLTAAAIIYDQAFTMPAATSACQVDPNDRCCRSCGINEDDVPTGCTPIEEDPNCAAPPPAASDPMNLRCFDQKRRFGIDLLYPIERYVAGFTDTHVYDTWSCDDRECPQVPNPLFPPEDPELDFTRRPSEVFVMSVVGVPWQDLATSGSLSGDQLTYKSNFDADDWSLMVGSPNAYVAPEDPFMVASPAPRSGTHPITGDPIVPETSNDPSANSINGHEFTDPNSAQLQYACIFPLVSPLDCTSASNPSCQCLHEDLPANSPLCQPPEGGPAEVTQYFAAATPGLRQLELMSKLPNGLPASICPKVVEGDAGSSSYGYNPAMRALLRKLGSVLE